MYSLNAPNPKGYGRPFSIVLSILSVVLLLASLYFFNKGWTQYTDPSFIDYQLRILRPEETRWLVWLFSLPLAAEVLSLLFLFPKVHSDKRLIHFYGFCLFIMSLCPLSYCWLWSVYTSVYTSGEYHQKKYSSYALLFIIILLIPVALMTYAILWKKPVGSFDPVQLTPEDVKDWPALFRGFQNKQGTLSDLRFRILRFLPPTLSAQILYAKTPTEYEQISKSEVIAGLNNVLRERHLHLAFDGDVGDEASELLSPAERNLPDENIARLNALLLRRCFPNEISLPEPTLSKRQQFLGWLTGSWRKYMVSLSFGVESAQFWVLVFFFTVFLGITYLFGFAFAFHDKSTVQESGSSALFMGKTSQYVSQSMNDGAPGQEPSVDEPQLSFIIYFASKSAVPQYKYGPFDDRAYENSKEGLKRRNEDWRSRQNVQHFDEAVKSIASLGKAETLLRIQLKGSADDSVLGEGLTYSSNYALSEARAQNVKFILLEKLRRTDNRERRLEWLTVPLSSESELTSPLTEEKGIEDEKAIQASQKRHDQSSRLSSSERRANQERENQDEKQNWILKLLPYDSLALADRDLLEEKIGAVFDLPAQFNISAQTKRALLSKIEELGQMLRLRTNHVAQKHNRSLKKSWFRNVRNSTRRWKQLSLLTSKRRNVR